MWLCNLGHDGESRKDQAQGLLRLEKEGENGEGVCCAILASLEDKIWALLEKAWKKQVGGSFFCGDKHDVTKD